MPSVIEGLGTEEIVDEVFIVMRQEYNAALAVIQQRGDEIDQARADRLGVEVPAVTLELVDDTPREGMSFPYGNFHVGSIPSFVMSEDRVVNYPMLVVAVGRSMPDPENMLMDQMDVLQSGIAIHVFARADPNKGEFAEVAYRRAMRMAEAVHYVVNSTSLRRLVVGVSGPILVDRSEPWYFPSEDGHGVDWCWMAASHQYQIKNYSSMPN